MEALQNVNCLLTGGYNVILDFVLVSVSPYGRCSLKRGCKDGNLIA